MKKTAIFTAIIALFTSIAYAQENTAPRLLTPEQIARIRAEHPEVATQITTTTTTNSAGTNGTLSSGALKIEDEDSLARQKAAAEQAKRYSKGIYSEIGQDDGKNTKALDGFANDLPLVAVLDQIMPEGWKATAAKEANPNRKVSWKGGQTWNKTLEKITETYGLYIMVNWNDKIIRVLDESQVASINRSREKVEVMSFGAAPAKTVTTTTTVAPLTPVNPTPPAFPGVNPGVNANINANANPLATPLVAGNNINGAPLVAPGAPVGFPGAVAMINGNPVSLPPGVQAPVTTWRIRTGSLRDNLLDWAEQGKFKLIYPDTVSNYPIDDEGFNLSGQLDGQNGVLAQLAALYSEGRVRQPLEFELKTGGASPVLIIRNKTYEQRFFREANGQPDPR